MAHNNTPSIILVVLATTTLLLFFPTILSFLLKKQKQRFRLVTGEYITYYPHKLFTYEVPLAGALSKRKIKKIRKHIEPRIKGEIFFLKSSSLREETNRLSFVVGKMFYFTNKQDIDLFSKSVNKFLKYELKKVGS